MEDPSTNHLREDREGEDLISQIKETDIVASLKEKNPLQKLLPRQRRFVFEYLKTKNRLSAWKKTHRKCVSDAAAYVDVNYFLKKHPEVTDWLYELAGISDDDFIKVAREGLTAKKTQIYRSKEYIEPDHYARFKAVELGLKLRGKTGTENKGNQMNIQIINDTTQGVVKIIDGQV